MLLHSKKFVQIKIKFSFLLTLYMPFFLQGCGGKTSNSGEINTPDPSVNPLTAPSLLKGSVSILYENLVTSITYTKLKASFNLPYGITMDQAGNLYVADFNNNRIRKITSTGDVMTIVGNGDGTNLNGIGLAATIHNPNGVAADSSGNIYVTSIGRNNIRKITPEGVVSTFSGTGVSGAVDGAASVARFNQPTGITIDSSGNLYVTDGTTCLIRRVDTNGTVLTVAGNRATPGCGAPVNLPGASAVFWIPRGIAIDAAGNLYVADMLNAVIRKIVLDPITHISTSVSTIAGQNAVHVSTDGAALGGATFNRPSGIAVDPSGTTIYVSDEGSGLIRRIQGGFVSTIAGGGTNYADGLGTIASFASPLGLTLGVDGNLYVTDSTALTIRKVTPAGNVTTIAGEGGIVGSTDSIGPRASISTFLQPKGLKQDSARNLYVVDGNLAIRKITAAGDVVVIAGKIGVVGGFVDGNGTTARFESLREITMDSSRNLYVTDKESIRKMDIAGNVTTIAGTNTAGYLDGPGTTARFSSPAGISLDSSGNLFIADYGNNVIRKIDAVTNVVTTFVGSLLTTAGSLDGTGNAATFNRPMGMDIDTNNNLYVFDSGGYIVRKITPGGVVTTIAGQAGMSGSTNGNALTTAKFSAGRGLAVDPTGKNIYLCDTPNQLIRKIDIAAGIVSTFAGTGGFGSADGTGSAASFTNPSSLSVGTDGNIYVSDTSNETIRKITPSGVVTTIAGTPGDQGGTTAINGAAQFLKQGGITKDSSGNVYVVDTFSHLIRKINSEGKMTVLAGAGSPGQADGLGSAASFRYPQGITINSAGNLYLSDTFNHTIRQITPGGLVTTFAGTPGVNGPVTTSLFNYPQGIAVDSSDNIYVADTLNAAIRKITSGQTVTTLAGQGYSGYVDGPVSSAAFSYLKSLTIDPNNNLYAIDINNNVIRKITNLLAIAPNVDTLVRLIQGSIPSTSLPTGVALSSDLNGNVYVVDAVNSLIQKVTPNGVVTTIAGTSGIAALSTGSLPGTLLNPSSIYVDPTGTFIYLLENNNLVKIKINKD